MMSKKHLTGYLTIKIINALSTNAIFRSNALIARTYCLRHIQYKTQTLELTQVSNRTLSAHDYMA